MMLTPRMRRSSPPPPARTVASSRHGSRSASATEIAAALAGSVAASPMARPTLAPGADDRSRALADRDDGGAATPRRPRLGLSLRRRLVALDVRDLAPQLADLVAQPGRVLEAQVLGRREHLLLELDDRLLDLGQRHVLRLRALALRAPAALRRLALGLEELGDVADALDDRRGRDAVRLVVGDLDRAAAGGLLDRRAHRRRLLVGIHEHRALDVACRPSDGLDE